jgi:serine/threonine-protein kinase HipA
MGQVAYETFIERLAAMLVVGNLDAHLKNWALIYLDGRTASLAPIYDFHSLTVYGHYLYGTLALGLGGESLSSAVYLDNFRILAENSGADSAHTVHIVRRTVDRLREAWSGELQSDADERFPALARHFASRLDSLPICNV